MARRLALTLTATATIESPRGLSHLIDQLRRAALSVPLNIAEAAGRTGAADAARHYAIARGSAMECAAIIDSLQVFGLIDEPKRAQAIELISRIVAMSTKLLSLIVAVAVAVNVNVNARSRIVTSFLATARARGRPRTSA